MSSMPWFPDFVAAVELARRQTRDTGLADPVAQYFTALQEGDAHSLETVWPGRVVIFQSAQSAIPTARHAPAENGVTMRL